MDSPNVPSGRSTSLVSAASVVLILGAAKIMAPILSPVLIAMLLALTIRPMVDWLARRRLGRGFALLVSFALIVAVGLGVVSLVGLALGRLGETLPTYQERLRGVLGEVETRLTARGIDISGIISSNVLSADRIMATARGLVGGIRTILSGALLILLLIVLFLAEMPLLDKILDQERRRHWRHLTTGIQKYIGITGLLGFVNALLNLILLALLGVDFAILWAVVCFFLNFVPAVGNILALTPPAILALLEFGWQRALIVVVGFLVTNVSMDLVLKPKLMQTSLDISPLLVILSLIFWGWVLGPAGAILAIPLTMVVRRAVVAEPVLEGVADGA